MTLKRTPLHELHEKLGAKIVPFAGYEMPIQYSSVKEESQAVRSSCGLFDVSHMGEFFIKGKDAEKFLDHLLTNQISGTGDNKAVYSPMCKEDGTILDDLIVYKIDPENFLICVNAANKEKDWNWISSHKKDFDISITDRSEDIALLAIQGPDSAKILEKLSFSISNLEYYSGTLLADSSDEFTFISRTGYTGEDGFELFTSPQKAVEAWTALIEAGAKPCGLASRDVLRTEVCFPLYGNELSEEVTPLDSNLKWTVKFSKDDFIGKKALENYEQKFKLTKLVLEKGIPRPGYIVCDGEGNEVGKVTSGTQSVSLGKGIALAHIAKEKYPTDNKFFIDIRSKKYEATVSKKSFVTGGHK